MTAEDGVRQGGAGMFLADALGRLADEDGAAAPAGRVLGVGRTYVAQGEVDEILAELGLDGPGIAASVRARPVGRAPRGGRPAGGRTRLSPPSSPCWPPRPARSR